MGSRGGDVLAPRKPFVTQMARHPTYPDHKIGAISMDCREGGVARFQCLQSIYLPCFALGVVEEGRGRGGSSSSKVSKIAGMFQGGGGSRGHEDEAQANATASAGEGPTHATVVRTESHLARFNNARALFEKMGQGDAAGPKGPAGSRLLLPPAAGGVKAEARMASRLEASVAEAKRASGPAAAAAASTAPGVRKTATDASVGEGRWRSARGESASPCRSLGDRSSSSSRSQSPSPSRATNGHAQDVSAGVSVGVGLRRPGSASSTLSTSSSEGDPPRRWPPAKAKAEVPSDFRRLKPEKPAKPENLERKLSTHEQHQELIARHKNWFQMFSKNRSPASSPSKGEPRPGSPSKPEVTPLLLNKNEEGRPGSPPKPDWKASYVSRAELRSPRGASSGDEQERYEERTKEKEESDEGRLTPQTLSEQEAWSSVLKNRYGPRAKDLLSPRTRLEAEAGADWRKERAAILSGRSGRRNSGSEEEVTAQVKGQARFEDTATLESGWSPPQHYSQYESSSGPREDQSEASVAGKESQSAGAKTLKEEINAAETERVKGELRQNGTASDGVGKQKIVSLAKKEEADLIVSESVVLKDSAKEKDLEGRPERPKKGGVVGEPEGRPRKETVEEANARLKESISEAPEARDSRRDLENRRTRSEDTADRRRRERADLAQKGLRGRGGGTRRGDAGEGQGRPKESLEETPDARQREASAEGRARPSEDVRGPRERDSSEEGHEARARDRDRERRRKARERDGKRDGPGVETGRTTPPTPQTTPTSQKDAPAADVVMGGVLQALRAETVYVSSSEDVSALEDGLLKVADPSGVDIKGQIDGRRESGKEDSAEGSPVRRQLFPDLVVECEGRAMGVEGPSGESAATRDESRTSSESGGTKEESGASLESTKADSGTSLESGAKEMDSGAIPKESQASNVDAGATQESEAKQADSGTSLESGAKQADSGTNSLDSGATEGDPGTISKHSGPQEVMPDQRKESQEALAKDSHLVRPPEGPEKVPSPPLSPRAQSLAALDALIHGHHLQEFPSPRGTTQEQEAHLEEILYDHTVTSAQHKIQFCTAPVTVEGLAPDLESHDTDPEPLPPPIPPHGVDPASITEVQPTSTSQPEDPEVMTADEAQRLLSAKESQSLLSDEEAQEVVLLLSPQEHNTSGPIPPVPQHFSDTPPAVPPHYAETAPPVPPHYAPGEDEYDTRVASHFDPTLTSPLSPEDEPSEADSSEASGDVYQVSRVKEVLVEDGVHYLEDGHFWVEVPGLPDEDEDDDNDPSMPYHPHTKLTFSKDPVQVFSTYSVTEYDRKNDEVDPVAASAEYELEKRVEKMDLFPVEIVKGEGGLGLSIIGMGVGADAGVEKLGIFVKTITQGGATERDGRIQVNDQIIEVDGKSLVGVTQVFAASVLKNTSGRVQFLIGREKDPENSEVALLIKQSLQADREREERRRALGGPDYDPHTGQSLFDPLSSPSEENSRSEDVSVQHNYSSYLEGASSPTSPDATSPPPEVFDLEGDTSDTSPDNDVSVLKLKLKEVQYRNAVAKAEITKLKMSLLEMEKVVTENTKYTSQLLEAQNKMADLDTQLQSKLSEVSTYQDMLEQSQGQFIVLEKKYYKAKKIIKEYQGRERDFLHREEYHITQLEEKDSHYNALVKALKDRVIQLEAELTTAQKKAGLPIQVPSDPSTQPAYWNLQQNTQSALTKIPVKEELDEAVPPHELLDVSASRAKGELASRGGLANRHLPSLKKTTSMSSASSQEQSLDDSSLDDDLPEAVKHPPVEATQDGQQDQGSRRSAETQESLPPHSPPYTTSSISYAKSPQPPSYTQATMGNVSHLGSPPPYLHPPGQFGTPRQPLASSHISSDPSTGLPTRPLGAGIDSQTHDSRSESRPEIPYRHPPPVARVQPVNRAEISESTSLASHLASRTPQQQSLAEQLKALLAERELESDVTQQRNDREASPSKRSPTSLMEDVRQAVMQADVTSHVVSGQLVHQVSPSQRSQSSFYSTGGRESVRDGNTGSQSPRIGRSSLHASPGSGVSASPSGVVLLSQRPLDSSLPAHKLGPGVDGSSGDLSSGPASLGSGDEGSGASLGSQSSLSHTHPPTERTKRSHMWQTAPVVDWTKEQVSQWLVVQGLESCVGRFQDVGMTGPRLLNLDVRDLKALGLPPEEKTKLKRKVKELRIAVEKERKQAEKEKKEREKLQKKAEKLAEKAEKKKK